MNEKEKRVAWLKLSVYLRRLADQMPDMTDQELQYLINYSEKQSTPPGEKWAMHSRTFERDWAIYETFQIFRLRGLNKMEARKKVAAHFKKSESRIRDGLKRFADLEKEGARPSLEISKDSKLPPKYLFDNPN